MPYGKTQLPPTLFQRGFCILAVFLTYFSAYFKKHATTHILFYFYKMTNNKPQSHSKTLSFQCLVWSKWSIWSLVSEDDCEVYNALTFDHKLHQRRVCVYVLAESVAWPSANYGCREKFRQSWMPFSNFDVSMETKYNFIICGFNIRIFNLFKINSSCLCVLYLISLMTQAYVIVVFIFNSLLCFRQKLETWLNYYLVNINVGCIYSWGFLNIYWFCI